MQAQLHSTRFSSCIKFVTLLFTMQKNNVSAGDIILRDLNTQQQQAVQSTTGPVLILAGAGSGKTKTLVHRIAYLIVQEGIKPWNILAVTFTNKAAANMKERMAPLIAPITEHMPLMGTFHSICCKLLRKEIEVLGYQPNFVIYDSSDQQTLVKKIMKDLGYDTKQIAPAGVHWRISSSKNVLMGPEEFADNVSDAIGEVTAKVYPVYQSELKKHNALDFDDLIMKVVELFKQYPDVLEKYHTLWEHILVDEYQDTNKAQYELVTLLAGKHKNICVVGDDAQSIYSWRQADIRNILEFEKEYPDATTVFLEQNYRSTKTILNASNEVIAKNKNQKKKKLWTDNQEGEQIIIKEVENEESEGKFIIERIFGVGEASTKKNTDSEEVTYADDDEYAQADPDDEAIQEGESILERVMRSRMFNQQGAKDELHRIVEEKKKDTDFSQFVVLYRTNAQSRAIEEAFLRYNIPYQLIGGVRFYERKEIRDVLAYFRSLLNPADWVSLERIANVPGRGMGNRTWFLIEQFARERNFSVIDAAQHAIPGIQNARLKSFYQFAQLMNDLRTQMVDLNPTELLDLVLKETGYKEYIMNESETRDKGEARWENIQELKTVTQKFRHLRGEEGLQTFLEDITLVSDQDDVNDSDNAVKLMTIHAAKGLEFPIVFVVGMEEGLFPHSRSLVDPKEMEEERRLCYVALTRAITKIYLVFAAKRMRYGNLQVNPPSRFLDEIPAEFCSWE